MRVFLVVATVKTLSDEFINELQEHIRPATARKTYRELSKNNYAREYQLIAPTSEDISGLQKICAKYEVDMALVPEKIREANQRLVVFDMDSTLIQQEVIVEMAKDYEMGDKVRAITERAMNGELDFDSALRERIALLKGFHRSHMEKIRARLTLSPGVGLFVRTFRLHGGVTAIASGGFHYFADFFRDSLPMEYAIANNLDWDGDVLSGVVTGDIVNAQRKKEIIIDLREKLRLGPEQTIAVGDGANDLLMLKEAGMGVAWHAKEIVRKEAAYHITYGPMTTLLYFLGYEGEYFEAL
ncbi:MAG: phosphoserine phosphatase SerB [Bacteriovoracaceae bacterium]